MRSLSAVSVARAREVYKAVHDGAPRVFVALITLYLSAKVGLLVGFAINGFFVMDEYQQGGYSQHVGDGFYDKIWPFKTVLYAYYYLPARWIADEAVSLMVAMRLQTVALVLASLGLLYGCARSIGRTRNEALLVVACTVAFSTFMERCYRVRSEPLALMLGTAALWVSLRRGSLLKREWLRLVVSGILCGLAFLSTQKAVWFSVALGLGWVLDGLLNKRFLLSLGRSALLLAGWCSAVLVYALSFRGEEFVVVLRHMFFRPMDLALHGGDYYHAVGLYVHQTYQRNQVLYLVCLVGWLTVAKRLLRAAEETRVAWTFSGVITVLVFSHNQPWPYVFTFAIPFVALWSVEVVTLSRASAWIRLSPAVLLAFFMWSFARNVPFLLEDNRQQNEVVTQAERYLGLGDKYVDGIGMVVTRRQTRRAWWDGPGIDLIKRKVRGGDRSDLDSVFAGGPKIIIWSYRTKELRAELEPYVSRSYIPLEPNLLVSGIKLHTDGADAEFVNWWEGRYAVYDGRGHRVTRRLRIDGTWIDALDAEVSLGVGWFLVSVSNCEGCLLLPADLGAKVEPAEIGDFEHLFDNVYSR